MNDTEHNPFSTVDHADSDKPRHLKVNWGMLHKCQLCFMLRSPDLAPQTRISSAGGVEPDFSYTWGHSSVDLEQYVHDEVFLHSFCRMTAYVFILKTCTFFSTYNKIGG